MAGPDPDERVMGFGGWRYTACITLPGCCMRPGNFKTGWAENQVVLAPRQPVTMTFPFSFKASPIASSDSLYGGVDETAGVNDHQVCVVIVA